jgi:hypothetical protein
MNKNEENWIRLAAFGASIAALLLVVVLTGCGGEGGSIAAETPATYPTVFPATNNLSAPQVTPTLPLGCRWVETTDGDGGLQHVMICGK